MLSAPKIDHIASSSISAARRSRGQLFRTEINLVALALSSSASRLAESESVDGDGAKALGGLLASTQDLKLTSML